MWKLLAALATIAAPLPVLAEVPVHAKLTTVTEWKAVFGRIEARNNLGARSRLGGLLTAVNVTEGSHVEKGQKIALVVDEKVTLQLDAVDAMITALQAQLENAKSELERGESLLDRGVTTKQKLDVLQTQVEVLQGQIDKAAADRDVLVQRETEGAVLAPITGTVLSVPVTEGSVIMPGEPVAQIGGGGFFLRLAVPERHAAFLQQGAQIQIGGDEKATSGTLAKIYPQIENGRVIADVDVPGMATDFIDARVLVKLPVDRRQALMVPRDYVESRMGLDFVITKAKDGHSAQRTVVLGAEQVIDGTAMVEILSGLPVGAELVAEHD